MELQLKAQANREHLARVRDLVKDCKLHAPEGNEAVAALIAVGPSFGPRAGTVPLEQPTVEQGPAWDEPEPGPGDVPPCPPEFGGVP